MGIQLFSKTQSCLKTENIDCTRALANLEEKVARFRQDVHFIRQNGDFPYHQIANMDETQVFFDAVPSKTVD